MEEEEEEEAQLYTCCFTSFSTASPSTASEAHRLRWLFNGFILVTFVSWNTDTFFALSYFSLRQTMVADILCEFHSLWLVEVLEMLHITTHPLKICLTENLWGWRVDLEHSLWTLATPSPAKYVLNVCSCQQRVPDRWPCAVFATIFWQQAHPHQLVKDLDPPAQLPGSFFFYEGQGLIHFIILHSLVKPLEKFNFNIFYKFHIGLSITKKYKIKKQQLPSPSTIMVQCRALC